MSSGINQGRSFEPHFGYHSDCMGRAMGRVVDAGIYVLGGVSRFVRSLKSSDFNDLLDEQGGEDSSYDACYRGDQR